MERRPAVPTLANRRGKWHHLAMTYRRLPLLLGFIIAVGPVSTDMYLPAFPAIARDFHNLAAPQYSLTAYFIGLAAGQMTQGPISDRFGRRAPLLAGLALYILASLGCAIAWNMQAFVAFRFLSALGCSAGIVIPRAMVRDLADGPAAAKLFSKLMLVMGVAPILAPMLGALCVMVADWRIIFVLCAAYGVLALLLVAGRLPDTLPVERRLHLSLVPVALRYVEIFSERSFVTHALVGAFTSAALFAYLAATPQIFIGMYHWRSSEYALLFGVNAAAYIAYNQLNPILVQRFGLRPVISLAAPVFAGVCCLLVALAWHPLGAPLGALTLAGALLLSEAGFGLLQPCAMVGALSRHQAHAGSASALLGTMQYGGGAVAGLAMGVLADGTARPMAGAMLLCALAVLLAAALRPPVRLVLAES